MARRCPARGDASIPRLAGDDSKGFSLENADRLAHFFTLFTIKYRGALVKKNLRWEEFSGLGGFDGAGRRGRRMLLCAPSGQEAGYGAGH